MKFIKSVLAGVVLAAVSVGSVAAAGSPNVANVEQLYAAVNDPANEGVALTLARGIYVLSAMDAAGVARPNGGRLELQRDMSLYGLTDNRAAVIIDATALAASSFTVSFGRTAVVRIGRGSNTIEWLTILGNPAAAGCIATELAGTASTRIRVAHVVGRGSSRGVDVRNVGADNAGRRIDAEIVDNEFFGPAEVVGMSEGIRLVNFVGANGGVIAATLSDNRVQGFQIGCIVANNRSSNALVEVRSSGDHFFANALGCFIAGGLSQATSGVANANSTIFEAHGSAFVDNAAPISGFPPGGIVVVGGLSTTQTNVTSNNTVSVALWESTVSGNGTVNFEAFGARQDTLEGLAGTNNHVTIKFYGVSKRIDVVATLSLPLEPSRTNTLAVLRLDAGGTSRLSNFSARGVVPAGGDLTVGFVLGGIGNKSVLVRAVGPTLGSFGVSGALADPKLEVFSGGVSAGISSNDDWAGEPTLASAFASVGAFPLPPSSKDAAVLNTLAIGSITARVTTSLSGSSGIALAEVYDRDARGAPARLVNISTLGFVGTGAQALMLGFVIEGIAPKRLLIRAVGPGLASLGVAVALSDPQLAVIPLGKTLIGASNDDWGGDAALASAFVSAGAFTLPVNSKDAAVVLHLPPGGYTVTVSGAPNTTGRALVEIYDLDP